MASSADSLTTKLDALADALRVAGVDPDRIARILGSAAEATMHALVLEAVLDERPALAAAAAPESVQQAPLEDEIPVRLAA